MVTDEVKTRNDTALSSYLLALTQEEEVVDFCSGECGVASVDNGSTAGALLSLPWNWRSIYSLSIGFMILF